MSPRYPGWQPGWGVDDFGAAYAQGASVRSVITAVLAALAAAPDGVLIGRPLADAALADADALDRRGPAGLSLFGVPIAVKDNIDVAGVPTTAACPGFTRTPAEDATVVARLRAAGAVIVAKTNMDQFATGLVGTRSPYGTPPNTLDPTLVPGGSSSGSAVSVALGLVPAALGTDTAGSGRVPAALNGIVGLKPTIGRASGHGIVPAMRRFDCPTVFARAVADADAVMTVMSGPDPLDAYSRTGPAGLRRTAAPVIGAPDRPPAGADLSPGTWEAYERALANLAAAGVEVNRFDTDRVAPLFDAGRLLYGSALVAERAASVGAAVAEGIEGLDSVVAGIVERAGTWSAADAYRAEYELQRLRVASAAVWDDVDVLALPTIPGTVTLAEVETEPLRANERLGRFTTFANLLDLCAAVIPVDVGPGVAPFGLQLVAPAWADDVVVSLGRRIHGEEPAAVPPVGVARPGRRTLVVVGAHLRGQPLHHQLEQRHAGFVALTTTAPAYRLYALEGMVPPKPGLVREERFGAPVEVEVWELGDAEFGSFVGEVPPPLCIGSVELADGTWHKGFLCEPRALAGANDITAHGGWRNYLAAKAG